MKKFLVIVTAISFIILQSALVASPLSGRNEYCEAIHDEDYNQRPEGPIQYGSIAGSVYGQTGWLVYPLVGALVSAGGQTDYTDLFGGYVIRDLPVDNTYMLSASKMGYATQEYSITLTPSNPDVVVHFVLLRTGDSSNGKINLYEQSMVLNEYTGIDPIHGEL